MLNERAVIGAAKYIDSVTEDRELQASVAIGLGNEVVVSHPYSYVGYYGLYSHYGPTFSKVEIDGFMTMQSLLNPDTIDPAWRAYFKEVQSIRQKAGNSDPIDIIEGILLLCELYPEEVEQAGFAGISQDQNNYPIISDQVEIKQRIDEVLSDQTLRNCLSKALANCIPDDGRENVETDELALIVEGRKLEGGILVDFGCGQGDQARKIACEVPLYVIGIDRQHRPKWYKWEQGDEGDTTATFIQADMREPIEGIEPESVDIVLMHFVVSHITSDALTAILEQALIILKPDGILMIRPANYEYESGEEINDRSWRYFVKTANSRGEVMFKRRRLKQLLTE